MKITGKKLLLLLTVILAVLFFGIYKLWTIEVYSGNIVSPCGKYRVDYYHYFRESLMPMSPAQLHIFTRHDEITPEIFPSFLS